MTPIHQAGEMAVWSEDKWAAFEGELQAQLRAERRRLQRKQAQPSHAPATRLHTVAWGLLGLVLLAAFLY